MTDDIICFYNNNLTKYKMIFSKMKFTFFLYIICIISLPIIFISLTISQWDLPYQNGRGEVLIFLVLQIALFYFYNLRVKKVLKSKYNIESDGFLWFRANINRYRKEQIEKYIESNNIEDKAIKNMYELLYKEGEKRKFPDIFSTGTFLILFIPGWSQVVKWVFSRLETFESVIFVFIIFYCPFVIILKVFFDDVLGSISELLFRQSERINNIARIVEEIYLTRVTQNIV